MTLETNHTAISISLSNDEEFRKLFDGFYIPLCVFAQKYVEDPEQSADIVQDCFVKLWQIRTDFFFLHQVKSFLYTAVRNKALNVLEHFHVVSDYAQREIKKGNDSFFYDHVVEEETYRILVGGIEQLPKQMKNIMLLALEGMSNGQIADEMNVSVETVRSLKKIAYRKLRDILKEYYYLIFWVI